MRRWSVALALVLATLSASAAEAELTRAELDRVAADPAPGARLDLETGLPTVLLFADFTCGHLCDAILAQTAAELGDLELTAGRDYALAVVGIDPRDGPAAAEAFVAAQTPDAIRPGVRLIQPDAARLKTMTAALGYQVVYDPATDRFAHPAVRYVLTSGGAVTQVVPAFASDAAALGEALAAARAGGTQRGVLARLALFCYGYDAETGRFDLAIERILMIASLVTALIMALAIGTAIWRERRRTG